MNKRLIFACVASFAFGIAGCRHAPVRAMNVPLQPVSTEGPVMVSVPPPTHRSTDSLDKVFSSTDIPVVKPVPQPKKKPRRTPSLLAATTPPPQPVPTTTANTAAPAQTLGNLTTESENPKAARVEAEQALRTQQDRIRRLSASVQAAHPAELDQARRFIKSAMESWNAADYTATLALVTKAKVLLDDLLK